MLSVKEVKHWINTLDQDGNIAIINNGTVLVELSPVDALNPKFIRVGGIPDELTDNVAMLARKSIIEGEVKSYVGDEDVRPVLDYKWFQGADAFQGDQLVQKGTPWVDPDDAPPLGKDFIDNAEIRNGDKVIRPAARGHRRTDTTVDTQYCR